MTAEDFSSGFASLRELALDLRWSWNHGTDEIWRQLSPAVWNLTPHPYAVLQAVPLDEMQRWLADPTFRAKVDHFVRAKREKASAPAWFQQEHPQAPLAGVAYLSMEFMLSGALPIYSGGLGNVAGDQLKTYSDLGVPVVAVGLLYQKGYFRQMIDREGAQQAFFPYNDPAKLPITAVLGADGAAMRIEMAMPSSSVWLRVWQVQVGRLKLYLLDSNDPANSAEDREITSELYGGGPELRLQQEIVLGIGGWRLLAALGFKPEVCHLNEGHAPFAVLERAAAFMAETGRPFDVALAITRAGNLFTTHTAVEAGFDRFSPNLIERYLGAYAQKNLNLGLQDLLALGRRNPNDFSELFNMAYLAIRGSGAVNGVSLLHGAVSRKLFSPLFPRCPLAEVPVGYITNGVHMPTWDSAEADALWTEACGKNRWLGTTEKLKHDILQATDARLWQLRTVSRNQIVDHARAHLARDMVASGATTQEIERTKLRLRPDVLTLGFARRFATYKRSNLLLHDQERLLRLLNNPHRPVQLILGGKAHPADQAGQALIQEWTNFIRHAVPSAPVVFLADYDMLLAEHLVQGVDVWLNTPRRPWEASGTSGMKVLVNGGLNLSELDGWWAEAYAPEVGWALGDGQEHGDDPAWDAIEAEVLYDRLEREVIPEFYTRDAQGIPAAWVARMRQSMARLTPDFSANRTVREYTEKHYLPAAAAYRHRAADNGAAGQAIVDWHHMLDQKWPLLGFGPLKVERQGDQDVVEVDIHLNGLEASAIKVELYSDGGDNGLPVRQEMIRVGPLSDGSRSALDRTAIRASCPIVNHTVRLLPHYEGVSVPLETNLVLWQK